MKQDNKETQVKTKSIIKGVVLCVIFFALVFTISCSNKSSSSTVDTKLLTDIEADELFEFSSSLATSSWTETEISESKDAASNTLTRTGDFGTLTYSAEGNALTLKKSKEVIEYVKAVSGKTFGTGDNQITASQVTYNIPLTVDISAESSTASLAGATRDSYTVTLTGVQYFDSYGYDITLYQNVVCGDTTLEESTLKTKAILLSGMLQSSDNNVEYKRGGKSYYIRFLLSVKEVTPQVYVCKHLKGDEASLIGRKNKDSSFQRSLY